ncbi:MAG: sugar transferase [Deltaproteobacteria bacterium]|nr:sugar transferase [Deltaproteobacteria bacterium]
MLANFLVKPSETAMEPSHDGDHTFYSAPHFHHMLRIERKRTERSKKPFLLILLDFSGLKTKNRNASMYEKVKSVIVSCSRETDLQGWYEHNKTIGAIFTEMASVEESSIEKIFRKLQNKIGENLDAEDVKKIKVSFHVFPEENGNTVINNSLFNIALYPDLSRPSISRQTTSSLKKILDITGSLFALLLFFPIFLIIAAAVKLTSNGPVFFKQERMGLNGEIFTFLKFRSMYTNSDQNRHKDYIKKYIAKGKGDANTPGVYKLNNDPRITAIGHFLRKTSLDELPQFINVLKGEMSLVGPRPPIPYECEIYDIWHRRRLLSVKPGITGLWQVTGRSSTTFDEMVRLDLKYINEWSLWLDIKLLLKTPWVILTGKGAY